MTKQEERLNAGRAVVAKVLSEEIADLTQEIRQQVEPSLEPDEKVTATLPDGTKVGAVSRTKVIQSAVITDMAAFTEWVARTHPEEMIKPDPFVRASFLEWIKQTVKRNGAPVDPRSGEIIPGMEIRDGTAMYKVTPTDEGRDVIKARIKNLIGAEMLALPPPGE